MTQATEWTDAQHRAYLRAKRASAGEALARRVLRALRQADALARQFVREHGCDADGECDCGFCAPDETGYSAGELIADDLRGSAAVFNMLINLIENEVGGGAGAGHDSAAGPDDADEPLAVVAAAR